MGANQNNSREINDFYPTPEYATLELLKREQFGKNILEPCCGDGAISKLLEPHHTVTSFDIIDRGFGEIKDFFDYDINFKFDAVITNPPYRFALDFVKKSLEHLNKGGKVAMLLKLVFLESSGRYDFFMKHPPSRIYVFSKRLTLSQKGVICKNSGCIAYAWFVWDKDNINKPTIAWICD